MTQCHFASLVYDETGRNELEGGTIMKIKKRVLLQAMEYAKNAAATDAVNVNFKESATQCNSRADYHHWI